MFNSQGTYFTGDIFRGIVCLLCKQLCLSSRHNMCLSCRQNFDLIYFVSPGHIFYWQKFYGKMFARHTRTFTNRFCCLLGTISACQAGRGFDPYVFCIARGHIFTARYFTGNCVPGTQVDFCYLLIQSVIQSFQSVTSGTQSVV